MDWRRFCSLVRSRCFGKTEKERLGRYNVVSKQDKVEMALLKLVQDGDFTEDEWNHLCNQAGRTSPQEAIDSFLEWKKRV